MLSAECYVLDAAREAAARTAASRAAESTQHAARSTPHSALSTPRPSCPCPAKASYLAQQGRRLDYDREFLQEAERRSARQFQMKEGTLYPALHLTAKGRRHARFDARFDLAFLRLVGPGHR